MTTREPRPDDGPGAYEYLTGGKDSTGCDSLIIWAEDRGKRYGITRTHVAEAEGRGKSPVLAITPRSLAEYLERDEGGATVPDRVCRRAG